jgi:hypothetical protein
MFYDVRMYGRGAVERLTSLDIMHLRDRSDDGFMGRSCIARARDVSAWIWPAPCTPPRCMPMAPGLAES